MGIDHRGTEDTARETATEQFAFVYSRILVFTHSGFPIPKRSPCCEPLERPLSEGRDGRVGRPAFRLACGAGWNAELLFRASGFTKSGGRRKDPRFQPGYDFNFVLRTALNH
jgi:hypothetical protein